MTNFKATKYMVSLPGSENMTGGAQYVAAFDFCIEGGALVFYDEDGKVCLAFGPTAWLTVQEVPRP